jgi:hypothetical protein
LEAICFLLDGLFAAATLSGVMTKSSHRLGPRVAAALLMGLFPAIGQTAAPHWNVLVAGARPDGQTDGTAVFQKLLDDAGKAGGGVVEVPAGRFRLDGNLSIPANVTLQGVYRVPPTPGPLNGGVPDGSVLLAYAGRGSAEGRPFIRLAGNNAALAGVVIAYPEWKQTDVPPVPYPPCVLADGPENVGVRDCCLLNPYEGIKLVRAARHLVRNITGYPSKRGIYVDECYDIGHIENVHFWPFGVSYQPEEAFCKWVNTQGVAFELARTDWHYIHNTFCFGYGVGYKFSKSAHGSANGNFLGLGADSCRRAVLVEQAQPPGLLISNGEFVGRWGSADSVCLEIGPEVEGTVSLANCSFWGPVDRCVWMRSAAGQFTASACHFVEWDNGGAGSPAIQLDAGRAIVQGCTFNQAKLEVAVATNVISAILSANQAEGGFRVRNRAGKRTQTALNEEDALNWTAEARAHYQITLGERGDARYLEGWHGPERASRPFRWSGAVSRVVLPLLPGRNYTLTLDLGVPAQALAAADAGLYLEGKQLAPLKNESRLETTLPPASGDTIELELRSGGWVPKQAIAGSEDPRVLGVQAFSLVMKAEGAAPQVFDANTGRTR